MRNRKKALLKPLRMGTTWNTSILMIKSKKMLSTTWILYSLFRMTELNLGSQTHPLTIRTETSLEKEKKESTKSRLLQLRQQIQLHQCMKVINQMKSALKKLKLIKIKQVLKSILKRLYLRNCLQLNQTS